MWMLQVLVYGLLKGTREIVKKKSLLKCSVIEVLFFYTLFAFLFVCADAPNAGGVDGQHMFYIAIKSFVIFLAWIFSFKAIQKMPVSLYGILDLSRVLFATLLATAVMHEILSKNQIVGLILVSVGLLMLKKPSLTWITRLRHKKTDEGENSDPQVGQGMVYTRRKHEEKEQVSATLILFALASCMLNALSGLMDKILMKDLTSSQLQFWYMLYLLLFYFVYIILVGQKINWKRALTNPWIWLLALLFVIADRFLFLANQDPNSRISVMTLIKQSGCIVTILAGKFIFHEKNIAYKLVCAGVVISGIVIAVL